jgi:glycosyltransferase involved in cell wall biosynthesis
VDPLVSVVTPTWDRHDLLLSRCIPAVQAQTYDRIEHIIVSDGPDPVLAELLIGAPVVYAEVPERFNDNGNWGSRARNHAAKLVTGELVAYLDDDNAWRPEHLARLVAALEGDPAADFAYSRMLVRPAGYQVGADPPVCGGIDTSLIMHRRECFDRFGLWPVPGTIAHCPDWELVAGWITDGARWRFVDHVTMDYYSAS